MQGPLPRLGSVQGAYWYEGAFASWAYALACGGSHLWRNVARFNAEAHGNYREPSYRR